MTRFPQNVGRRVVLAAVAVALAAGCRAQPPATSGALSPVYNKQTGKLEQLLSDRNGDGKVDTWAFMDGTRVVRIEIDRNGDGKPDRWEYYSAPPPDGGPTVIERATEANSADPARITRHEFYDHGVLQSVDDDTDGDGRPDKWETYEGGRLTQVDLDLSGRGKADRRLVYQESGVVTTEVDPHGDGHFVPMGPSANLESRGRK